MKLDSLLPRCKFVMLGLIVGLLALPVQAVEQSCMAQAQIMPDQAQLLALRQLAQNQNDDEARLCLATAAFMIGDFKLAAQYFQRLARAEIVPEKAARLYSKAGWAFMRANQPAAAGKEFATAIKQMPKMQIYWHDHVVALMQTEQYWDAQHELDYALGLAPQEAALWALRADCWMKLGVSAKAKSDARQALTLQADNALALGVWHKVTNGE